MWMMSVPIATCTVTGICRRQAAAATLICANGGCDATRNLPTDCPRPSPAADTLVDRAIQLRAGFLGHAERAGAERRVDIL